MCPKHNGKVAHTFTLLKACQYLLRVQTWPLFPSEAEIGEKGEVGQQELLPPACAGGQCKNLLKPQKPFELPSVCAALFPEHN